MYQRNTGQTVLNALQEQAAVVLLGPRQVGKTTLALTIAENRPSVYLDLEREADRGVLVEPDLYLDEQVGKLVILDEVQQMPGLFSSLRGQIDARRRKGQRTGQFLLLGSASNLLLHQSAESLAGRVRYVEMPPLLLAEVGEDRLADLWLRGGFPRSFLADSEEDSLAWREGFIRPSLERDIPQLGITIPAVTMRRFWTMLAHYHGQTWNAAEIGRSMGLSDKTVRSYLDILTGTFMIRQLQPWFENLGKRQVKSPKIFFRDTGLLHSLLDIPDGHNLLGHPKVGASWEGFVLEQALQILHPNAAYFWGTHAGAELDLVFQSGGNRYGIEIKFNEAPTLTPSMRIASSELSLEHLWVVYPGNETYPVMKNITFMPLKDLETIREKIK
jgi:predicted AAA+ superfamily ATPase